MQGFGGRGWGGGGAREARDWEGAKPAGAWCMATHWEGAKPADAWCMAIHWEGAKPASACLAPSQDHQDTQDTQEGVAGAKRVPLADYLQARSGSPLAALPHPGCPGGLGCPGRPPSNEIPCGRPSHWKAAILAGKKALEKAQKP